MTSKLYSVLYCPYKMNLSQGFPSWEAKYCYFGYFWFDWRLGWEPPVHSNQLLRSSKSQKKQNRFFSAKMAVTHCCCCVELKKGVQILAWVLIVLKLIGFIAGVV
jgi:hypothetical protein